MVPTSLLTSSHRFNIRLALAAPLRFYSSSSSGYAGVTPVYRRIACSAVTNNNNNTKNGGLYNNLTTRQHRYFSSKGDGIFSRIRGFFQTKQEERKEEQAAKQIEKMASLPTWTIKAFIDEVDSSLSSWTTKIPGMGSAKQIKAMKESKLILNAFVEEVGENAQIEDLIHMNRKQKLKISIKGEVLVEDINLLITQFRTMALMHRVLRYRKEHGKPLPTDEATMRMAMTEDAQFVVSSQEKKEMREDMQRRKMPKNLRR